MLANSAKRAAVAGIILLLAVGLGISANRYGKPKTVIHVVTLNYVEGTTDAQRKEVVDGIERMASQVPGIRNVWLKPVRVQGYQHERLPGGRDKYHRMTDAFVIEFESLQALDAWMNHPAHRAWEKVFVQVRERSAVSSITND